MAKKASDTLPPVLPPRDDFVGCRIMQLPEELHIEAAKTATEINPANRPSVQVASLDDVVLSPAHLAVMTSKYWGAGGVKLGVAFLDVQDPALKAKILYYANSWNRDGNANIVFTEASASMAQVRVTTTPGSGYWSYLGVDILHIPRGQPTLNLDSFSLSTPESEYRRVVPHEFFHTCGGAHEAPREAILALLDEQKTLAYFERTQGWSEADVRAQILTPIPESQLMANAADVYSCMCYAFPGSVTKSGQPIPGGSYIDSFDADLASRLYPKAVAPPPPPPPPTGSGLVTVDVANRVVRVPAGWTTTQAV